MVPIKEIATLVAHKAYETKKDPNKVFLEILQKYPQATLEHRKRVIEMANKKLFHLYYKDGVYEFPLVDPKIVLSMEPTTSAKTDKTGGLKKAASVHQEEPEGYVNPADFEIDGTFATSETAAVGGAGYLPSPRWWKTASDETDSTQKIAEKLRKQARVQELLSGKGMKIPTIELIRPYVDSKIVENLEFKKAAGAQEDDTMARELLELLAVITEGGD